MGLEFGVYDRVRSHGVLIVKIVVDELFRRLHILDRVARDGDIMQHVKQDVRA